MTLSIADDDGTACYPDVLDELWRRHRTAPDDTAPTVISTFAGAGGSSLGYSAAGYKELLATDWNEHAARCFARNFDVPYYCGDIADLSAADVLDRVDLSPGDLDVLDGSPPCQGFSTSGDRNVDDKRNQLFRQFARLIDGLRPKTFVMENVSGLVKGRMKPIFAEIMNTFQSLGYRAIARQLYANRLGVPQTRPRIIIVGVRDDVSASPVHPSPKTRERTVRDGVARAPADEYVSYTAPWQRKAWSLCAVGQNLGQYDTEYTADGSGYTHRKIDPNRSCPTILKTPTYSNTSLMHWAQPRSLSIGEIKALTSFPEQFSFVGDFDAKWKRIGNCVPPLMMFHIARQIREDCLDQSRASDANQED